MRMVAAIHLCRLSAIFREINVVFIYFSVVMIVVVVSEVVGLNKVCVGGMMYMNAFWDWFVGLIRLKLMMVCMCMSMFAVVFVSVTMVMVMIMVVNANITMVVA